MGNHRGHAKSAQPGLIYYFMRGFLRMVLNIFFRHIEVTGLDNVPMRGPVIFVGNHQNQFVDGMMLFTNCGRDMRFLVADKTMKRKFVGGVAKTIGSIGVARGQDSVVKGKGTVTVEGTSVSGNGTEFKKALHPNDQISVAGNNMKVVEIVSDTQLVLEKSVNAKLVNEPYKILPHIDQSTVYESVWATLFDGNCIGIFPEGGSHDQASLLPLKAGVTVMALGAMKKYPGLQVSIVPCGLNYINPHKFRSTAFIEFGPALKISPELLAEYETDKRAACSKLLVQIEEVLRGVTINAPDYATRQLIRTVRRLFLPSGVRVRPEQYLIMTRRFLKAYQMLPNEPDVVALRQRVLEYDRQLKIYGIHDRHVQRFTLGWRHALELLFSRMLGLFILVCLALPGMLLHAPVGVIAGRMSAAKARQAKAESSVKIKGLDVLASWKIIIAAGLVPLLYLCYGFGMFVVLQIYCPQLGLLLQAALALYFISLLPWFGYASVRLFEEGKLLLQSLRPLFLAIFPWGREQRINCYKLREELRQEVMRVVAKYGPMVMEAEEDGMLPDKFKNREMLLDDIKHLKKKLLDQDKAAEARIAGLLAEVAALREKVAQYEKASDSVAAASEGAV
eukprot:Colp12_sorted_trinity150504_noHs@29214